MQSLERTGFFVPYAKQSDKVVDLFQKIGTEIRRVEFDSIHCKLGSISVFGYSVLLSTTSKILPNPTTHPFALPNLIPTCIKRVECRVPEVCWELRQTTGTNNGVYVVEVKGCLYHKMAGNMVVAAGVETLVA